MSKAVVVGPASRPGVIATSLGRTASSVGPTDMNGQPLVSGLIFPRLDTPFIGEGQQVSLSAEQGYTEHGKLKVPFRLQLPPHETIQRQTQFTWTNFDVFDPDDGASERTRRGGRRLRTVAINTMFLSWRPSFEVWSPQLLDPILAARELEHVCLDGLVFRLRIRNKLYDSDDVNMLAVLLSCNVTEEPGEPDTRYVQLQFQEYRPTEVERRAIKNELGPWRHDIAHGDTLYALAKHYYRRQSDWKRIARANGSLDQQPPSHDLWGWRVKHHHPTITIPQRTDAAVAVAA